VRHVFSSQSAVRRHVEGALVALADIEHEPS
jgi:hypothetical protein